ncbi:MAG: acylphosphatase [Calditrichaeota bacterium]|nr:MAG: acylphosphatase [Calditrichota bacterium]
MSSASAEIKCIGNVQGVGYRYFCLQKAKQHNLTGWVKNCPDGTVDLAIEGEKQTIEEFITLLKEGPRAAEVTDVLIHWGEKLHKFSNFEIRY